MKAWTLETSDSDATHAFGVELGRLLEGGEIILLRGELGAGKTCLAGGIAEGLGVREPAVSPSYVIQRTYPARDRLTLHHFDFYRLEGDDEADAIGAEESADTNTVVLVEWPERCPETFRDFTLEIRLNPTTADTRILEGRWGPAASEHAWSAEFEAKLRRWS